MHEELIDTFAGNAHLGAADGRDLGYFNRFLAIMLAFDDADTAPPTRPISQLYRALVKLIGRRYRTLDASVYTPIHSLVA